MKKYDRLIFVSSSDTAVGPMAEAILQSKFLLEELEITSKGVVVLFPEPIESKGRGGSGQQWTDDEESHE